MGATLRDDDRGRRAGWPLVGALVALAVARRLPAIGIELPVSRVTLARAPEEVMARLRQDLLADAVVECGDTAVARFAGRAGLLRYETVELIRFLDGEVTFEHLRGPFARCTESFVFVTQDDGSRALEHRGAFAMRGGLLGWLWGKLVVRNLFDRHVLTHMEVLAGTSAPPAREQDGRTG